MTFNINSIATVLFGMLLTIGLVEKITEISEDDRKKLLDHLKKVPHALGVEINLHLLDDKAINCLIYIHSVNIQGKNILISVFSNITEIKKNQEALKFAEKQLNEPFQYHDRVYRVTDRFNQKQQK
jgi:hypothetical protein